MDFDTVRQIARVVPLRTVNRRLTRASVSQHSKSQQYFKREEQQRQHCKTTEK